MPDIKQLSPQDIGKIAAGEVIERPASVLKELLENAVDAGAKTVRVEFEGAGARLLRVTDDGAGMTPANLRASCRRHATSKITSFADLASLATFGFRGEALYSVAAVSRLSITSCTHEPGTAGLTLSLEGGFATAEMPAPPVPGTVIEVRDLFFNTPARLKFLKGDGTERAHLLRAAEECALANPGVCFHVEAEGRRVYALPAVPPTAEGLMARAAAILGAETSADFLSAADPAAGVTAFASAPGKLVARRDLQFFFVNRRPVASRTLSQALYKAYEGRRDRSRHPACVIYLELDPASFDVNVHPQKKEVRFSSESSVFSAVYRAVGKALLAAAVEGAPAPETNLRESGGSGYEAGTNPQSAPGACSPKHGEPAPEPQAPPVSGRKTDPKKYTEKQVLALFDTGFMPEMFKGAESGGTAANAMIRSASTAASGGTAKPAAAAQPEPAWWTPPYRFLGQFDRSYLLFECAAGLLIMDQHAAQERVLFEQYLDQFENETLPVQSLMLPVSVEMSASAVENLMRWKDWLARAGFEIEQFGPRTVLAHCAPALFSLNDADLAAFLQSAADMLGDPEKCAETVRREVVAMAACKRAVKAHDTLGETEAMRLLRDLKHCRNGLNCPHGRPTMFVQPESEIARRFHRT